jgi:hypothetical protein
MIERYRLKEKTHHGLKKNGDHGEVVSGSKDFVKPVGSHTAQRARKVRHCAQKVVTVHGYEEQKCSPVEERQQARSGWSPGDVWLVMDVDRRGMMKQAWEATVEL